MLTNKDLQRKWGLKESPDPGAEFVGFLSPQEFFAKCTLVEGEYAVGIDDYFLIAQGTATSTASISLPVSKGAGRTLLIGNKGVNGVIVRVASSRDTIDGLGLKHVSPNEVITIVDYSRGTWLLQNQFFPNTLPGSVTRTMTGSIDTITKGTRIITLHRDGLGVLTGWEDMESVCTIVRDGLGNLVSWGCVPK